LGETSLKQGAGYKSAMKALRRSTKRRWTHVASCLVNKWGNVACNKQNKRSKCWKRAHKDVNIYSENSNTQKSNGFLHKERKILLKRLNLNFSKRECTFVCVSVFFCCFCTENYYNKSAK